VAAVVVFVSDQYVKARIVESLPAGASVPLIPGLVSLTHVQNRGVAFGLLAGAASLLPVLAVLTLVLLLAYNRGRQFSRPAAVGVACMAGGAIGNLADRFRLGHVVDYVDVHIWPVFNLADVAIVIGAGLLLVTFARGERSTSPGR